MNLGTLFISQFYQQTDGFAMGGAAFSTTTYIYVQAHEETEISAVLHPPKVWERFDDDIYFIHFEEIEDFIKNVKWLELKKVITLNIYIYRTDESIYFCNIFVPLKKLGKNKVCMVL